MKRRTFSTILLFFFGLISFTLLFGPMTSKAAETPFGSYRFATPTATVRITGTPYYQAIWRKAITAWNNTGVFTFKIATNAQVQAKAWRNTTTQLGVAGQTQLFNTGNLIRSAVTQVNSGVFRYYNYSQDSRVIVAEHELGHVIGLNHNPSPHSVMYFQNRYVPIQSVDIQSVRNHYALPLIQAGGGTMAQLNNSTVNIVCSLHGSYTLGETMKRIIN